MPVSQKISSCITFVTAFLSTQMTQELLVLFNSSIPKRVGRLSDYFEKVDLRYQKYEKDYNTKKIRRFIIVDSAAQPYSKDNPTHQTLTRLILVRTFPQFITRLELEELRQGLFLKGWLRSLLWKVSVPMHLWKHYMAWYPWVWTPEIDDEEWFDPCFHGRWGEGDRIALKGKLKDAICVLQVPEWGQGKRSVLGTKWLNALISPRATCIVLRVGLK